MRRGLSATNSAPSVRPPGSHRASSIGKTIIAARLTAAKSRRLGRFIRLDFDRLISLPYFWRRASPPSFVAI